MGPIAAAVTRAVTMHDEEWFWWIESAQLSDIHRRQAWPANWSDAATMRVAVQYPVSFATRRWYVLAEAAQ